jgi:hypothetical protein
MVRIGDKLSGELLQVTRRKRKRVDVKVSALMLARAWSSLGLFLDNRLEEKIER